MQETTQVFSERQLPEYAPSPESGLQRLIYAILNDTQISRELGRGRDIIWNLLPMSLRRSKGAKQRFTRALANMSYTGRIVHRGDGVYMLATKEVWQERQEHVKGLKKTKKLRSEREYQKAQSIKKPVKMTKKRAVPSKKLASSIDWPGKEPVLQRIDKRIAVLKHKLTELQALRDLFVESDL